MSNPFRMQRLALYGLASGLLLWAGCTGGPSMVEAPDFDPATAASAAIELYDTNGDGKIGPGELDASPAIAMLLNAVNDNGQPVDKNGDKALDAEEIAARIQLYLEYGTGRSAKSAVVTIRGSPLVGADVIFEPEPFVADVVPPAKGVTDDRGYAFMSVENVDPPGVTFGFFRVRVSKKDASGKETIPAKYNTETTLGTEIAPLTRREVSDQIFFRLK